MVERAQVSIKKSEAKSQILTPHIRRETDHRQSMNSPVERILFLQRTIGNQAVEKIIKSGTLQAKLRVGEPGDVYEREADRVAEQVMRMPDIPGQAEETRIKRKCPKCLNGLYGLLGRDKKDEKLQAEEIPGQTPEVTSQVEANIKALRGGGQSLPQSARAFFEPRLGQDFSQVRTHTDAKAVETARAVNARAFTVGQDIIFGAGQYSLETTRGKNLLAHELTHVVQQNQIRQNNSLINNYLAPKGIACQKSPAGKKVYESLFIKPLFRESCKKWIDETTDKLLLGEFRDRLEIYLKGHPMSITGEVPERTTKADIDEKISEVVKKIKDKFGSHIESTLSDTDIKKNVQILTSKETSDPDFINQWLGNWIFKLTSIADYCVDEGDKRFKKVISNIRADTALEKTIRTLASRQAAFFKETDTGRTVYIHKGLETSEVEKTLSHEIIHFYAHGNYRIWNSKMIAPRYINEGFTEFLTREATAVSSSKYQDRYEFIREKVAKYVPTDDIAAAYFAGKVWKVEKISKVAKFLFKQEQEKIKKK